MELSLRRVATTETARITVLARRSGVGKETIRNIIWGAQSARIDNLEAIVEALGRSLHELFDGLRPEEGQTQPIDDDEGSSTGVLQRRSG